MTCDDIRQAIYVYLDGEFAPGEAGEFEQHLRMCADCSELATREGHFLGCLKRQLSTPPAPAELRTRVLDALSEMDFGRRPTPPWVRWGLPMATAAGVAVLVGWGLGGQPPTAEATTREVVATHRQDLPMEVRGSVGNIERFLHENAKFDALVPFQDDAEVRLLGARLTQINGRQAIVYNYDFGGRRLTVLQQPQVESEEAPDGYQVADHQGYRVVSFRTGPVMNSVVGAVGSGEVGRLLVPVAYRGVAASPR
jgi:mycothiol system anti-sigma-R factor